MSNPSMDMLARLSSGVGPARTGAGATGKAPLESVGFQELLARASRGDLGASLPVEVPAGFGMALTDVQSSALSQAVDAAALSGATRLLAAVDGQVLTVDVASRTVVDVRGAEEGLLTDFDAAVFLPPSGEEGGAGQAPGARGAALPEGIRNASLQTLLASIGQDGTASQAG